MNDMLAKGAPSQGEFLNGGGDMGSRMRSHDWSGSPIGYPETWPQSLRSIVDLMINSRYPMFVAWGPQLAFLYNDGYTPIFGAKHPHMLGVPFKQAWGEIWGDIFPLIEQALAGEATYHENLHLVMERNGYPEDTWYSFSYSPVRDESGAVAGMFCACTETTGQVLNAKALRTSEERLQLALDAAAGVGAWDWDVAKDRVFSDAAFARLYGVDPERAAAGAPIAEFTAGIHPDDAERVGKEIEQAMVTGEPLVSEYRLVAKDGKVTWVSARGRCHLDGEGRPLRFPGVTFDMTDRKRAEEALAARNRRLALLARVAGGLMHDTSPQERLKVAFADIANEVEADYYFNFLIDDSDPTLLRLDSAGGLSRDQQEAFAEIRVGDYLCGRVAATLLPVVIDNLDKSDDPACGGVIGLDGKCYAGFPLVAEGQLIGTISFASTVRSRFTDEQVALMSTVASQVAAALDRSRAEAALRESEKALRRAAAEFEALAENVSQLAWMAEPDGSIFWYNKRWYDYTGTDLSSMRDWGWREVHHPDHIDRVIQEVSANWAAGKAWEGTYLLRSKEGTYRWFLTRAEPIRNEAAELIRWFGTNTDVSAQLNAEAQLRELNATLEARVTERTLKLEQSQETLRQSQKMEAIGQLTGGIAHDFNNLLTGISGSLELLSKRLGQGSTNGVERYLTSAQEASRRAAALTQRLLAFSRRQTLDPKPVDVNKLIAGMEDLIRRSVGPNVELEVVYAGGLWPTKIDGPQLENALLNLCINARDAMAPNGGRLTIETANKWLDDRAARERDLPPGQYLSLCVTDTGTGMTQEVIDRAFDPFFTTKPLGQGTGLGLSMVYGFVRQSGGQIRIYSELGVGTTMCLYLPRFFGAIEEAHTGPPLDAIERGNGETVLIVDDEPILRMLMLDILQENGYRVIEAIDGPSALKILDSNARIDLLITDVGLPGGMNGRQVADAGRRTRPDLKVLFITGYAENAVVGNGQLGPGMEILTKPFEIAVLGEKVRDMIER